MTDYKCSREEHDRCAKNALCHLCDGKRLYSPPKEKKPLKRVGPKKKKEGMDFEKRVTKKWNQANNNEARRRPNSGAIGNLPGDIATPQDLMECKERGSTTSKGEKNFTIELNWILKVQGEVASCGKSNWYIPFCFKNHDEIFLIKSFDHELELLQTIEQLQQRIKDLEKEK